LLRRSLRKWRTGWLTGGLHLLILWMSFEAESADVWPFSLAGMAIVSFFAWMANYRRYRQIHDLPTSKVASAAQGYVELFGRSVPIPDSPILAPLSGLACCWYSYTIEEKGSDNKWKHVDSGESIAHFLLVDDTGQAVISPDGAEICYARSSSWTQGDRRYTEELLVPQGELYALGEFVTTGGAELVLEENRDVSELLADWKKDQAQLLERFDTDKSGQLDLAEWERARLEAQREIRRQHAQTRTADGVHMLRKPADGRVFILAAGLPERIGRRYALWSWVHLVVLFGAGIGSFLLFKA
jgi:hypothetical protein